MTAHKLVGLVVAAGAVTALASSATAEPKYKLNRAKTQVVSISGLSKGEDCHPFTTTGRVTEQNFTGPLVSGFTIAEKDGSRSFINVDPIDLDSAGNMLAVGWLNDGLQKMLRKGKRVSIRLFACGAAGRVLTLDAVKPN